MDLIFEIIFFISAFFYVIYTAGRTIILYAKLKQTRKNTVLETLKGLRILFVIVVLADTAKCFYNLFFTQKELKYNKF